MNTTPIKNCLTCAHEPEWIWRATGHLAQCEHTEKGILTRVFDNIGFIPAAINAGVIVNFTDCPAYQPKGKT